MGKKIKEEIKRLKNSVTITKY